MKRSIITIDREKCTGCGECIPNCPEGALQIIDNKACLLSDLFCDGLGACIGHCPEGAITIEEREAEDYDERKVMSNVIKQGPNVIKAHLDHLKSHKQEDYVKQAEAYLKENNIEVPSEAKSAMHEHGEGCPGSRAQVLLQAGCAGKWHDKRAIFRAQAMARADALNIADGRIFSKERRSIGR